MRSLYLRIWLTVIAALALFAGASGWMLQRHVDAERGRIERSFQGRAEAWAALVQKTLPAADAPQAEQAAALNEWSQRLRLPMALDDAQGRRIGATESWLRRETQDEGAPPRRGMPLQLEDGRTLWISRSAMMRRASGAPRPREGEERGVRDGRSAQGDHDDRHRMHEDMARRGPPPMAAGGMPPPMPDGGMPPSWRGLIRMPGWPEGATGVIALLGLLFMAVAAGAYPVVRRLTRRLEDLKSGVEAFGAGALSHRVDASGRDEVAALAGSFNQAAQRIEALLRANQSLLANASHELRSPLARLKMAVEMLDTGAPQQRESRRDEIRKNIKELDELVDEVLLASRLDAAREALPTERVNLMALAVEEAARTHAQVQGDAQATVQGDERLLRRAVRNLLENARRYGNEGDVSGANIQGASNHIANNDRANNGINDGTSSDGTNNDGTHNSGSGRLGAAQQDADDGNGNGNGNGAGVEVQIRVLAQQVELVVCDRGPGVPPELRERIFEAFFRLPGHAEREGGVGLGLALVRQIATRHDGQVRCEARLGGGSCFYLTLPRA